MSDKVLYRKTKIDTLAFDPDVARHHLERIYEGLVVDVIIDHKHPRYSIVRGTGGYNVGSIKVRIFDVNQGVANEFLSWADPIDSTLTEYPLYGELVQLVKIRGNFFYTTKIPVSRLIQENAMLKLNEALSKKTGNIDLSNEEERSIEFHKFGKYYLPDSRVRQLKHFEGDILHQGRMGHSIRFGSSKMDPRSPGLAPNILLRTGQAKGIEEDPKRTSFKSPYSLILEDINEDVSSIWMTSDQHIPFYPSTIDAGSFYRSIHNPPQKFDGGSILMTSDRVILNSKRDHILLFANEELYMNSIGRLSMDTDKSVFITAKDDVQLKASGYIESITDRDFFVRAGRDISMASTGESSIISRKTFIGSIDDDREPMVAGTTLSKFLARLINVLMGTGTATPPPPSVSPGIATTAHGQLGFAPVQLNPLIVSGLQSLYVELSRSNPGSERGGRFSGAPFNSRDNYLNISNESRASLIENNNYESGDKTVIENNEWDLLNDDYYKVVY